MVNEFQEPRGVQGGGRGSAECDVRTLLETSSPLAFESLDEGQTLTHDSTYETPFAGIKASGVHAPPLTRGSLLWVARFRRLFGLRF